MYLLNHIVTRKINFFLLVLLFFAVLGCKTVKKNNRNNGIIVYRLFDSLENIICKDINELKNKDSTCIVIEPLGDFRYTENWKKDGRYIYKIRLFYEHSHPKDSIFNVSNRKMEICGKLYPVYINCIDDVFCEPYERKNDKNILMFRNSDLYSIGYYEVDMFRRKILYIRP